jgi:hypothetical protein
MTNFKYEVGDEVLAPRFPGGGDPLEPAAVTRCYVRDGYNVYDLLFDESERPVGPIEEAKVKSR